MSVINESQPGDELICLEEFSSPPEGERPSVKTLRTFRVGERVRYVTYFQNENLKDNPVCWMVVFQADDGKRYDATQTYFVTKECWENLERHFAKQSKRTPNRPKTRRN